MNVLALSVTKNFDQQKRIPFIVLISATEFHKERQIKCVYIAVKKLKERVKYAENVATTAQNLDTNISVKTVVENSIPR